MALRIKIYLLIAANETGVERVDMSRGGRVNALCIWGSDKRGVLPSDWGAEAMFVKLDKRGLASC